MHARYERGISKKANRIQYAQSMGAPGPEALVTDLSDPRPDIERARERMFAGSRVPDAARYGLAKRIVLRLAHGITAEQVEFNRSAVAALESLQARLGVLAENYETLEVEFTQTRRTLLRLQANLASDEVSREMAAEARDAGESPLPPAGKR